MWPDPAEPLVTVVIICQGDPMALSGTVRSIQAQTLSPLELVLVGDPAIEVPKASGSIVRLRSTKNKIQCGGYLCVLAEGIQLDPTYLEKCVYLMKRRGLNACAAREEDGTGSVRNAAAAMVMRSTYDLRSKTINAGMLESLSKDWLANLTGVDIAVIPEVLARRPAASRNSAETGVPDSSPAARLSVLVALPYLAMGGAEAVVSRLARQLTARGFRIFVVTTQPKSAGMGDATPWFDGCVAGIYHLPQFLDPTLWPEFLSHLIQQHRIRVVWQIGSSYLYTMLPAIRQMFPSVAIIDLLFNPVGHTAQYLKYSYCMDHVVTEHDGMKSWLLEHGEHESHISVIPNCVDTERFSPRPAFDWRTGLQRQPEPGRFVAGFLGRLSEEKGPDIFIEIAHRLAGNPGMEFLVCGDGPMEESLRAAVRAKGLAERVHFLGFVPAQEYLPACDAVVVCSRIDGRPNIIMESLAMGIPVVASRTGGIPAMVSESAGILCEPGGITEFVQALEFLAGNREQYRQFQASARSHAIRYFSNAASVDRYAELFERMSTQRQMLRPGPTPAVLSSLKETKRHRLAQQVIAVLNLGPLRSALLLRKLRRSDVRRDLDAAFDERFYRTRYTGFPKWGFSPLLHYVLIGYLKGWNPSAKFDSESYWDANPDVARTGLNPLLHYLAFGRAEGRPGGFPAMLYGPPPAFETHE